MIKIAIQALASAFLLLGCSTTNHTNKRSVATAGIGWSHLNDREMAYINECAEKIDYEIKGYTRKIGFAGASLAATSLVSAVGGAIGGPGGIGATILSVTAFYGAAGGGFVAGGIIGYGADHLSNHIKGDRDHYLNRAEYNYNLSFPEFTSFVKEQQSNRPGLMTQKLKMQVKEQGADYEAVYTELNNAAKAGKCSLFRFNEHKKLEKIKALEIDLRRAKQN